LLIGVTCSKYVMIKFWIGLPGMNLVRKKARVIAMKASAAASEALFTVQFMIYRYNYLISGIKTSTREVFEPALSEELKPTGFNDLRIGIN